MTEESEPVVESKSEAETRPQAEERALTKSRNRWAYVSVALIVILFVQIGLFSYVMTSFQRDFSEIQFQHDLLMSEYSSLKVSFESLEAYLSQLQDLNITSPSGGLSTVEIYDLAENSVVLITVKEQTLSGLQPFAEGSGFVYDMDGHIVTNNHVIENADVIEVTFSDGTIIKAQLVGADPYADLAVIRVDRPSTLLYPLLLGRSSELRVGENVLAIGNPYGLSNSMSLGIVSQVGRQLDAPGNYVIVDVIQVDSAINPGNSGGPLMNMRGEVVGVNTAIIQGSVGVGFAIPSDTVSREIPQIIHTGKYIHPWLGISTVDLDPDIADAMNLNFTKGALVVNVIEGSPAASAGIKAGIDTTNIGGRTITLGGDLIIGVDDIEVRKLNDLVVYTERNKKVSDMITLQIVREGQLLNIDLTLGARPSP